MELLFATYDSTCVGHAEHFPETLAVLTAAAEPKMHHMLLDHVTRMVTPFMVQDERNAWQLQLWGIYSTTGLPSIDQTNACNRLTTCNNGIRFHA